MNLGHAIAVGCMAAVLTATTGCTRGDAEKPQAKLRAPIDVEPEPIVEAPEKEDPALANVFEDDRKVLKQLRRYRATFELDDASHVISVKLEGKQVTDRAIDEVVKLPEIRSLSLAKSSITDAGLAKLKRLAALESLGITDTPATDRGLKHLEAIPTLKFVWVCTTEQLTQQGVSSLQQVLPGVRIFVMNEPQ